MPTILEVLQRENPKIIDHWGGVSYKNTTSTRFDEVTLKDGTRAHVQEWKDFTYGSIYAAYGDILDQPPAPSYKPVATPSTTPTEIIDENGVDTLGIVWSCNIERQPLKVAGAILRQRKGMVNCSLAHPSDPTLASKIVSWKYKDDQSSSMKPDWTVHDRTITKTYKYAHDVEPPKYLVYAIGDSKLTQKWKSSWLTLADSNCTVNTDQPYHPPGTPAPSVQKTKKVDVERVKPLKQMATYCRTGETRYGYIVTQTELVAMRVRRIPGTSTRPVAAIEYRSIPWAAHGHGKLTAHLAIWALGCMGMNDAHRNTEGPNGAVLPYMAKLTWWVEDKAKKTFTNVISQRVLSADNWGKLKPGVTLHTDDAGKSPTSDFIAGVPPVPNLTQSMANLSLGKPTGTPPPAAPKKNTTATPSSANKPKAYTKCKIGGKLYSLVQDKAGNYVVLGSDKKTVKYKIGKDAAKKAWVVNGTSTVVQME